MEKEWQAPDASHVVDEMLNHEVGSVSAWLALPFKGTKSTETFFFTSVQKITGFSRREHGEMETGEHTEQRAAD